MKAIPCLLVAIFVTSCASVPLSFTATIAPTVVRPTETPAPTATPDPCPKDQLRAYLALVSPILNRFTDTSQLANSTARIALSSVVSNLQEIKRDFAAVPDVPHCAALFHFAMSNAMDLQIQAYLAFMAQDDSKAQGLLLRSSSEITFATSELNKLRAMAGE